ncbi:MAG TPA: 1-acyl-sn-glycerol-3-phosphate acyltransferase [Planctomycetaceae bacterium]|nr:1-acyl-sn-glycerol-3-phosphate acyltransferase [Planctomycetaceae bacterium]
MQSIIVEKPYQFLPPHRGNWIPSLIQSTRLIDHYLWRFEGIGSYEVRGADLLRESLRAGQGVLLAPNHCRYADPIAIGWLARAAQTHVYAMASWHLFNEGWLKAFAIRLCGGFSVYREGLDRKSLDMAIETLTTGERPLVVFPEGTVARSNDLLQPLLDGVAFIARSAAKKRAKQNRGKVVVHPVAIKYLLRGDVDKVVTPIVADLEKRLLVDVHGNSRSLRERILVLGEAVLAAREVRTFGRSYSGCEAERRRRLIEQLLANVEQEWNLQKPGEGVLVRVRYIRSQLVRQLDTKSPNERTRIWKSLEDIYIAQQVAFHPVGYLDAPTDTRILESVERIDEDVNDYSRRIESLHAILDVGEPIEVDNIKPSKDSGDPLMQSIESSLKSQLAALANEAQSYRGD